MNLALLFFITSIIYSSVGFGGGSTYLALMLLWGISYAIFPVIALMCNIIVVSGNCFNYIRRGNYNINFLAPFLVGSIPFAYFGGTLLIDKYIFELLLFTVLLIAGVLILFNFKTYDDNIENYRSLPKFFCFIIGSILGFVSGIVGIGGGIFLSPILFLLRAERPKIIITSASIFILINSVSGIFGQLTKYGIINEIFNFWYLYLAVFVGGQIGNYLSIKIIPTRILAMITSVLVIAVALRIGFKIF